MAVPINNQQPFLALSGQGFSAPIRPLMASHLHVPSSALFAHRHVSIAGLMPTDDYISSGFTASADKSMFLEEEDDAGPLDIRVNSPPASTPYYHSAPVDPVSTTTEQATTTTDPLEAYSLKEFPWALPLLNATSNSLLLRVNGTEVSLKLSKDNAAPESSAAACSNAPGGGAGSCVYLTRCAAARDLSASLYESAYCIYDSGYAGVCCPEHKDDAQNP